MVDVDDQPEVVLSKKNIKRFGEKYIKVTVTIIRGFSSDLLRGKYLSRSVYFFYRL